jgi:hypothetical protein
MVTIWSGRCVREVLREDQAEGFRLVEWRIRRQRMPVFFIVSVGSTALLSPSV